ncbi:MAG: hypothetical protein ABI267_10325 [Ginsengibacter sp.]
MKTFLYLFSIVLIFSACKKSGSGSTTPPTNTYANVSTGSSWNYQQIDSSGATPKTTNYTITSTANDTTINTRKYHVYNYSYGGSQYLSNSANEYYQFDSIPVTGGSYIERLYLKDNVSAGTTWSQNFNLNIPQSPVPISLMVTNTLVAKGISMTVNGVPYSDVIHVSTSLSSVLFPANSFISNIDSYYAPKVGLIENTSKVQLDFSGLTENLNTKTELMSSDLK